MVGRKAKLCPVGLNNRNKDAASKEVKRRKSTGETEQQEINCGKPHVRDPCRHSNEGQRLVAPTCLSCRKTRRPEAAGRVISGCVERSTERTEEEASLLCSSLVPCSVTWHQEKI